MRMLRYLFVAALVCGLTGVAKADDYAMVIIDPPPPPPGVTTYQITSVGESLTLPWSSCVTGELPPGSVGYIGCISLQNLTGQPLTNFELTVPDTGGIVGQTANCPTDPNDVFQSLDCDPNPVNGTFYLDFTDGDIPSGEGYFIIAEYGADPTVFPDTTAITGTPEPSSILLLSTGVLSLGVFGFYQRRRTLCASRPALPVNLN
jgi:hypothetical protein